MQNEVRIVTGLTGIQISGSGLKMSSDTIVTTDIPDKISDRDIQRMERDLELLSRIIKRYPEEIKDIFYETKQNNLARANRIAKRIGLTEGDFIRKGGGQTWVGVLIGIAIIGFLAYEGGAAWEREMRETEERDRESQAERERERERQKNEDRDD
jgi:hypothetical protein